MSERSSLTQPSNVRYIYDGSLIGFYCCVHASIYNQEFPAEIYADTPDAFSLFPEKYIESNEEKAVKVRTSIGTKISPYALHLVENVFLCDLKDKETAILDFLIYGYEQRTDITKRISVPCVHTLLKAERNLFGECHQLKGFIRFADYEGILVSEITPKHFVLPFLRGHFICRYPNENFIIIDRTHQYAFFYENRKGNLIQVDDITLLPPSIKEKRYQEMWKHFYDTIAIEGRRNERCRMGHMPKRFWGNMVEVRELVQ